MLQLVDQYPDSFQIAAACTSDDDGVVCVDDAIWAALPVEQMLDEDIMLIEREIVGLYGHTTNQERGGEYRGAIEVAMTAARATKPVAVPEPKAATQVTAVVVAAPSTRVDSICRTAAQCRPLACRAVPRPTVAPPRPSAMHRPTVAGTLAGLLKEEEEEQQQQARGQLGREQRRHESRDRSRRRASARRGRRSSRRRRQSPSRKGRQRSRSSRRGGSRNHGRSLRPWMK